MFDLLGFLDLNPIHVGIVLLIALLLFGPQKLPEIGRQLGSALRDLRKAGGDVMRSLNTDHEPEDSYRYPYSDTASSAAYQPYAPAAAVEAPPDLTDYTIAGQPVNTQPSYTSYVPAPVAEQYAANDAASSSLGAPEATAASEGKKEGAHHV